MDCGGWGRFKAYGGLTGILEGCGSGGGVGAADGVCGGGHERAGGAEELQYRGRLNDPDAAGGVDGGLKGFLRRVFEKPGVDSFVVLKRAIALLPELSTQIWPALSAVMALGALKPV